MLQLPADSPFMSRHEDFRENLGRQTTSDRHVTSNQCGCIKGSGTMDAIHAARLLVEQYREKNRRIHVTFLDLENSARPNLAHPPVTHWARGLRPSPLPQRHQRGSNPSRNITALPHHRQSPSRISSLAAPIHPLHGHGDGRHSNRPPMVSPLR